MENAVSMSFSRWNFGHLRVTSCEFLESDMHSECFNSKLPIGRKELGIALNTSALKDSSTNTNKDVIYFFGHTTDLAIPSQASKLSSL